MVAKLILSHLTSNHIRTHMKHTYTYSLGVFFLTTVNKRLMLMIKNQFLCHLTKNLLMQGPSWR